MNDAGIGVMVYGFLIEMCYFSFITKFVVYSAAIVMLYYPRFHDEEGLSKANVIKAT